ncbi:transporter substrate-binding domain-containing protein [Shewanella sp. CG12_big_fil_rev_8_21_14_0_65_47_15]|uniref:substrate-binding periplasmic protein n=1 Tax=Shewanella sp. CG12_big_fil_rev_8_21_14_0_65_47_15 TaxID=1975537 RepID=UPI000CB9307F|nr:transporter substrate-binding domain-containing protein [Shewanella sp. CG12_big_fil_rev_8_21_14_0_65_47_15]PIW59437.1 MAG: ABC transporter substrate-binding protein [Shewanella sp. CG12_big_fil_rev_8_21_14_0_65_47_15]
MVKGWQSKQFVRYVLFGLCLIHQHSFAVPLKYNITGSYSWYPYFIGDQPQAPGMITELIPMILSLANIEGEILSLPPKRTNNALETGLLDFDVVSPSWFEKQAFGPQFVQSAPIMQITEYVVTLPENVKQYDSIDQIKGKAIGTVRGYLYHNDKEFIRVDFTSEQELIKALNKHRIDAIIVGNYPALYWSSKLGVPVGLAAIHSNGELVLRLRKEHAELLPAINQAITTLKANGKIDEIIKKYTQTLAS